MPKGTKRNLWHFLSLEYSEQYADSCFGLPISKRGSAGPVPWPARSHEDPAGVRSPPLAATTTMTCQIVTDSMRK